MLVSYNGRQYKTYKEFRIDVKSLPKEAKLPGDAMVEGMYAQVYGRKAITQKVLFVWKPNEWYGAWGEEVCIE